MDSRYVDMAPESNIANTIATIFKARRAYLSVLLSRRSARTGRIVVHRSSVMTWGFSIRTHAISAET